MINVLIDGKNNGSLYIKLITEDNKAITLKDAIKKGLISDDIKLGKDYTLYLITSIKSKLQFRKIVEHKKFFTAYKELSAKDVLLYLHKEFNFNIYPAGHKIK